MACCLSHRFLKNINFTSLCLSLFSHSPLVFIPCCIFLLSPLTTGSLRLQPSVLWRRIFLVSKQLPALVVPFCMSPLGSCLSRNWSNSLCGISVSASKPKHMGWIWAQPVSKHFQEVLCNTYLHHESLHKCPCHKEWLRISEVRSPYHVALLGSLAGT